MNQPDRSQPGTIIPAARHCYWMSAVQLAARAGWCWLSLLVLAGNLLGQETTHIRLTDVSDSSGIEFVHTDGGSGQRFIVESVVGGLATFDYDGDGRVDIFFPNGAPLGRELPRDPVQARAFRPALYRNLGDFKFTDATQAAGLDRITYGMGAVAADYDEDGDVDLYVSNFGQNILYRNNGDGTFVDSTAAAGLNLPDRVGAGCAFLDAENDGDLDLYVGSYVQFTLAQHQQRWIGQHAFHPGPTDYPASPDALFLNAGDGTFVDVSQRSGIASQGNYSMGVVALDVDDDADTDIMVANDQRPNTLWINDGRGNFEDHAVLSGVAFDRTGKANGNMGIEVGDVNNDGLLDLFTTTYQDEMPVLYRNLGGGLFMDETNVAQIDHRLHPHVTWGCGMVDFDHDGDLDLYVACGHFMDNIQHIDDRTAVKVRDFMLENRGGKFVDVTSAAGSGMQMVQSSRGAAFEDFDNDGDIDVVVLNANARPGLLRNDSKLASGAVLIQLVGVQHNRGGIGAKLSLKKIPQTVRPALAGRGYQSHYGTHLHVTVRDRIDLEVVIHWPGGVVEYFSLPQGVLTHSLVQGRGEVGLRESKAR